MNQVWHLRNPDGASMGLEVATARMAPADRVLAHALPERVSVEVRDEDGDIIARGDDLADEASTPMALLEVRDGSVSRANVWPDEEHLGLPVILPGGEVGILQAWWNAEDGSAWRWSVEFSNQR